MITKLKHIVCTLAFACAVPTAFAQPQAGDWEFTLGGGGVSDNDFDSGAIGVNGSFGYFFTPAMELAVRQSFNFGDDGEESAWSGGTRLAFDYHFQFDKFVPFIGANIGIEYNDEDSVSGMGPEVGFKYFVHEKTFIFVMGEYRWLFDELEQADDNASDGSFAVTFGIGFNIGGRK